jgi:hypothetical protein
MIPASGQCAPIDFDRFNYIGIIDLLQGDADMALLAAFFLAGLWFRFLFPVRVTGRRLAPDFSS